MKVPPTAGDSFWNALAFSKKSNRRKFSAEFRAEAVELVISSGRPIVQKPVQSRRQILP